LVFKNATKNLLDQLEMTIKLIRSKGIGIFFITQSPTDIPASVLGQLGTKVQHALRAFTAKDRKDIKSASENYPSTDFYVVNQLITQLGTGEAFVTGLDEKGRPTELAHTLMRPPYSRMDVLNEQEINSHIRSSALAREYNVDIDRESAYEILQSRVAEQAHEAEQKMEKARTVPRGRPKAQQSTLEKIIKSPVTNTIAREVTRGLLGVLGIKTTSRGRSRSIFKF
jgi:hypothetical protein